MIIFKERREKISMAKIPRIRNRPIRCRERRQVEGSILKRIDTIAVFNKDTTCCVIARYYERNNNRGMKFADREAVIRERQFLVSHAFFFTAASFLPNPTSTRYIGFK